MESTKSEDCLIFYALTPEITKLRSVYDIIGNFMQSKQSIDPSDRFNLIWFQEDGPNYLDHFTFDSEYILKTLKSLGKNIARANIAGGVFIAITFIIEVFKKISEKFFRLLILVDEGAHEIPESFLPALEELIKKVRDMPFFVDIIFMGNPYSDQAQKLLKIANLSNGELFGIKNIKELNPILTELSEKKRVSEPSFVKQKIRMILPDNQPFYIHLADEPSVIDEIATCSICFNKDDEGIVKCPSCDTPAHKVCWAQWAETSSIGIPYVFRCHNCFNILKVEKEYLHDVRTGKIPTIAELTKMKKRNIIEYLHEIESKNEPKVVHTKDPVAVESQIMVEERKSHPEDQTRRRKKPSVKICPNCSKIMMGDKKNCPSCGFVLF